MEPFKTLTALAVPMDRVNVDTDAIIPKQFLKSIHRTGFGANLFDEWRFLDADRAKPNPEFVLNFPRYQGGRILLTRDNFGCGSSREHAPWALLDYGFRCLIGTSYADIFYSNSLKNGLLPCICEPADVDALFAEALAGEGCHLTVNLESSTITSPGGLKIAFKITPTGRHNLLNGLDEIGLTLKHEAEITAFEERRREEMPWVQGG